MFLPARGVCYCLPSPICMKPLLSLFVVGLSLAFASLMSAAEAPPKPGKTVALFDGKSLAGWEGDAKIWRVEDGCLTGGSLSETVRRNEFLASTRHYTNLIIRFKIRLFVL